MNTQLSLKQLILYTHTSTHIKTKNLSFFTQNPAEIQYPEFPIPTSPISLTFSREPIKSNRLNEFNSIQFTSHNFFFFFWLPVAFLNSPWSCSPARRRRQQRRRWPEVWGGTSRRFSRP